jgi:hypothetical protein
MGVSFFSPSNLTSYILEETPRDKKKIGQTLISFAHHMNIKGKSFAGGEEPEAIDLVKALKEKNTCGEKLEESLLGWSANSKFGARKLAPLALGFGETLGYALIGWGGILGSAFAQFYFIPKFQGCVDVLEGYYAQMFLPAKKEKEKTETPEVLSTEKVESVVKEVKKSFTALFGGAGTAVEGAVKDLGKQLEEFVKAPEENEVLEAILKTFGTTTGSINSLYLFYFWIQGNSESNPLSYKTDGELILVDPDKNASIRIDFKEGKISVDGSTVVENKDLTRLSAPNLKGPFIEIPQKITKITVPDDNELLLFEMNSQGELFVKDDDLLDCIKNGLLEQQGIKLESNNLAEAFGLVKSVVTTLYPNIYPLNGKIIAEGSPRKIAEKNAKLQIFASMDSKLLGSLDNEPFVGKMRSIQFENGVIVFQPETRELLVWLKRHEKGILSQNDVVGVKVNPTSFTNALGCEEPAFNVSLIPDPDSPAKQARVEAFNQILAEKGPFDVFNTDKFIFIFYTDKDCNKKMRVINKETGEIQDFNIRAITPSPKGFEVIDDQGKKHSFEFNAENGVPTLTYNGIESLLKSMSGPNGSFWYDPDTGQWVAENAQLLPLLEAFKQKGIQINIGDDGKVKGVPGGNPLNINIGQNPTTPFNLPSLPENKLNLLLFLIVLLTVLTFTNIKIKKN